MSTIDWSLTKFRASSWGNLLAESKTKGEPIGKTCASELIKIYCQEKYGRRKDIVTKQMDKGIMCEPQSIALFSMVEGEFYFKNEEQLENDDFSGHPDIGNNEDIRQATLIHDIKTSWDIFTFMAKLGEKLDPAYEAQLNVYFDLVPSATEGSISYCLVSAPENMVLDEKRRLLYSMDVATEENPAFKKAAQEIERMMLYDDIDPFERVIKIPVKKNEELIQKMKSKVPIFRQWLEDFEKKHMNLYAKQ